MKSIYRKLKDYIQEGDGVTTSIFGTITSSHVQYSWQDDQGEWQHWTCCGIYGHEKDFLLNYYVRGIVPYYRIVKDKIEVYINVTLSKEIENGKNR